ncbi:hypothetical protein B0T25DRAFT_139895 [Lasiosphaeria hispida]|uniref:Uncharacterized protein n=1 Tax=Lasiosphaeria hispida TaxID=260671 RepID=A0AAJ0HKY0_9PEZI|nr:hypothetical protein B0T25DRAFT_139895 [Lasiosphaeria hispida]
MMLRSARGLWWRKFLKASGVLLVVLRENHGNHAGSWEDDEESWRLVPVGSSASVHFYGASTWMGAQVDRYPHNTSRTEINEVSFNRVCINREIKQLLDSGRVDPNDGSAWVDTPLRHICSMSYMDFESQSTGTAKAKLLLNSDGLTRVPSLTTSLRTRQTFVGAGLLFGPRPLTTTWHRAW